MPGTLKQILSGLGIALVEMHVRLSTSQSLYAVSLDGDSIRISGVEARETGKCQGWDNGMPLHVQSAIDSMLLGVYD